MTTKFKPRSVMTPVGMLMFNHLFVAEPVVKGGEPRFNFTLLLEDEKPKGQNASAEWRDMRAAVAEAIDHEWGAGKAKDAAFVKTLRLPFRDALEKSKYTGFVAGKVFINPWTKDRPGIVDAGRTDIIDPKAVWAGQLCRATVVFFPYQQGGNKGVSCMLNNVQITKADMPRMDGKKSAASDFTAVGDSSAPADDSADDSPF